MTNFILFHKGDSLPEYIKICIEQIIKTQTNYKIFLLTNLKITNDWSAEIIDINQYDVPLNDISYYKNDPNPLWRTSLERLFYINAFITHNNLTNNVHFDNDVLIYKNIEDILTILNDNIPNIGLTPHNEIELVCGFMFIKEKNSLEVLCHELLNLVKLGESKLEEMLQSMPNEMRLLGHLQVNILNKDHITSLPVSPLEPGNNMYELFNGVFDPSSYGQFFGLNNNVNPVDVNRLIDRHIVGNKFTPVFDSNNYRPYIQLDGRHIPIFNLHIHNKRLHEYSIR